MYSHGESDVEHGVQFAGFNFCDCRHARIRWRVDLYIYPRRSAARGSRFFRCVSAGGKLSSFRNYNSPLSLSLSLSASDSNDERTHPHAFQRERWEETTVCGYIRQIDFEAAASCAGQSSSSWNRLSEKRKKLKDRRRKEKVVDYV